MKKDEFSPMMKQYFEVKNEYKDCILFYRLGDFYEMFFDDAKLASKELELTLTGRECGKEERAPMCGVPFHSSEAYIARLIERGYKVAICEQTEDPKQTKGLVSRNVVRVVTPGTVFENSMLETKRNNFITTVYRDALGAAMCFVDVSTGEVNAVEITTGDLNLQILAEIYKFLPSEIIFNSEAYKDSHMVDHIAARLNVSPSAGADSLFDVVSASEAICEHFKVRKVRELGIGEESRLASVVGAMLNYLKMTQMRKLSHIQKIRIYGVDSFMQLDENARRNLELNETIRARDKRGTLMWVLDRTQTAMGSRLLRRWVDEPLINVTDIHARLDAVDTLLAQTVVRGELSEALKSILDIERLCGRASYGIASGPDMKSLYDALCVIPMIKNLLKELDSALLCDIDSKIDMLDDVCDFLSVAISDTPANFARDGKVIRDGFNEELDNLRDIIDGGNNILIKIEERERERTGIRNLKVAFNRVFGYYIEVSKSNVSQVPDDYIRKQTLTNGERFITQELKEFEVEALSAKERALALETELFREVLRQVADESGRIKETASAISKLDVLVCLADCAARYRYVRPIVDDGDTIEIKNGRHPVVERMLKDEQFVPNDTMLNCTDNRMAIITGPNMAGKSTYMRQVALITLMAQIGSFVPAEYAKVGVVDKIFTRIGASDDLSAGKSTFMVEMSEVADIIKNATQKSLIILDEIGRGTSTFDGMSIARAVIEHLSNTDRCGAKTLFATHYHELTALEGQLDGVKNYNIVVKKEGFDITFLRKIMRGGADDSYGIEVARLAGLPESLIHRAKNILNAIENEGAIPQIASSTVEYVVDPQVEELLRRVAKIDINTLTPLDAHKLLYNLILEISKLGG